MNRPSFSPRATVAARQGRRGAFALAPVAAAAALLVAGAADAQVLPTLRNDGLITGADVPKVSGTTMEINQTANRAVIEWSNFSIGAGGTVAITQPARDAVLLNRVINNQGGSRIDGALTANGRVFIIDPSGLTFGRSAQVNVGSLIASTMDLATSDTPYQDFLSTGNVVVRGGASNVASLFVENGAQIRAGAGGSIALLSENRVDVNGTVSVPQGQITLSSGGDATIGLGSSGFIDLKLGRAVRGDRFAYTPPEVTVGNNGDVEAAGGQVRLEALGEGVNTEGGLITSSVQVLDFARVSSSSTTAAGGRIELDAGPDGTVLVGGGLLAESTRAAGGTIQLRGDTILITGLRNAESDLALLSANGATGGGTIDIGGAGTGSLLVQDDATLRANATANGNGGTILARATRQTNLFGQARVDFGVGEFYGDFSAAGGPQGGNGGLIDTSAPALTTQLVTEVGSFSGTFRAASQGGTAGLWQVEAAGVTIQPSAPSSGSDRFDPAQSGALLQGQVIGQALGNGTSVTIRATAGGNAAASLSVNANTSIQHQNTENTAPITLALQAKNSINIGGGVDISSLTAPMDIQLLANQGGQGGTVQSFAFGEGLNFLRTAGGDLLIGRSADPIDGFALGTGGGDGVALVGNQIDTRGATGSGNVLIQGRGQEGEGSGAGVSLSSTNINAGTGSITIRGRAIAGAGVRTNGQTLQGTTLIASGGIRVEGVADNTLGSPGGNPTGLDLSDTLIDGGNGGVTLAGRGANPGAASGRAMGILAEQVVVNGRGSNAAATLTVVGEGTGGVGVSVGIGGNIESNGTLSIGDDTNNAGLSTADVVIGASGGASGDALDLESPPPVVRTTGRVNVRPAGVDLDGNIVSRDTVTIAVGGAPINAAPLFRLATSWLQDGALDLGGGHVQAGQFVVGSSTHTGAIVLDDGVLNQFSHAQVTLQNQGAGSQGIVLGQSSHGLNSTLGTRQLTLMTNGSVTFAGTPVVPLLRAPVTPLALEPDPNALNLDKLVIVGGGTNAVQLSSGLDVHRINHLSFQGLGSMDLLVENNMAVEGGTATGFNAASQTFQNLAITTNTATNRIGLRTQDGSITLAAPIVLSGAGSTLNLIAPLVFTNTAGAGALSVGSGGTWQVWTEDYTDDSRGGLAGTGGMPNAYNCNLDALNCGLLDLAASSGFRYQRQPTLTVTATPVSFVTGSTPPAIPFIVSGLVNGDTIATAFSGALSTTATSSAAPGTYPVINTLVSKQGYLLGLDNAAATAVTVLAAGNPPVVQPPALSEVPGFGRSRALNSALLGAETNTEVNGRNLSRAQMCVAPGALRRQRDAGEDSDNLGIEWSRVRSQPHLSSCLDLGDDSECAAF